MIDEISRLEAWYDAQCDGDWEHSYGVTITSLDNPGWKVEIDLVGTPFADKPFVPVIRRTSDRGWIHCEVTENQYRGAGGPQMLRPILETFLSWAAA
jgi:hypothetical protein